MSDKLNGKRRAAMVLKHLAANLTWAAALFCVVGILYKGLVFGFRLDPVLGPVGFCFVVLAIIAAFLKQPENKS